MGVRCVVLFAVLVFANLPAIAFARSSCPGIHLKILNIRNGTGTVDCARCDFEDIPPGTYALAVIHDENMNGKLDTNWLGIPIEGYGFSNGAKALLDAPSYPAASFQCAGGTLDLTISLHY